MSESPKRGISLHTWILFGLILGAACGVLAKAYMDEEVLAWLNVNVMKPVGDVFLNMLLMTVVPLVFASLSSGVAQLGDLGKLGRIGAKVIGYFVLSMSIATVIGLVLVNSLRPGDYVSPKGREDLAKQYRKESEQRQETAASFGVHTFVNIVPRNPIESAARFPPDMLAVIFFALLFGAGLTRINPDRASGLLRGLEGITDIMVFIIGLAMRIAPFGVFAFLFRVSSTLGVDVVRLLGMYVFTVLLGLAIHFFVGFSALIWTFSRMNPLFFFGKVRAVIVTAFSTSSSSATLPTSIKVTEEQLGVPPKIAGFVLPLGATMNMNGTALFEGVTVVFLAQATGVELHLGQQLIVIAMSVLMAIGAAGVPGGSLPLLMIIMATVGVKPENIAIILGVDRILDMCRTTLNVVGDVTCATFIARSEGTSLPGQLPDAESTPQDS
jgi:DAACS family dicarboxylate/amino acid:cation (Na+ or H+) symporter